MLLVSYIQQYLNTSITVLTNQVWKLLIALLKVPNTGALTVLKYCRLYKLECVAISHQLHKLRVRLCLTFEAKISVSNVVRAKRCCVHAYFSNKRRFKTRISNKQRFKTPIQNGVRSCLTFEAKISVFKRG